MPALVKTIAMILAAASMAAVAVDAYAAEAAPIGAWRTTNECFLAVFVVVDNGSARAAYMSGERDDEAAWTWDGTTLKIISATFPMDSFTAHLANDRLEADYVWHDLDKDMLNRQSCIFEKVAQFRLF